jgi:hypothetical protein
MATSNADFLRSIAREYVTEPAYQAQLEVIAARLEALEAIAQEVATYPWGDLDAASNQAFALLYPDEVDDEGNYRAE